MLYLRLSFFSILLIGMPLRGMDGNDQSTMSMDQLRLRLQRYAEWPEDPDDILYGGSLEHSLEYTTLKEYVERKDQPAVTLLRALHAQVDKSVKTTALQVLGNVAKGFGQTIIGFTLALASWESGALVPDKVGLPPGLWCLYWGMRGAHTSMEQLDHFGAIHEKLAQHKTTLAALLENIEK